MLRQSAILVLALWAAMSGLISGLAPAEAEPVFPLGIRVGLEPPGGLKLSDKFAGFQDDTNQVSIMILELPGRAYEELERAMGVSNPRGLIDPKRESFAYAQGTGVLLSGQSNDNGVPARHWFLLAGQPNADVTTLINVGVPDSAKAAYPEDAIRRALATVSFRPMPIQEQLGMMPFKLGALSGFRVMQVMREGAVALTDGPGTDLEKQPSVIVSVGPSGGADTNSRSLFARDMLTGSPFRELSLQSSEPMRIGGLPGIEIKAQARAADGTPLSLVQWVRFGSGGFLRILAVSSASDWTAQYPRFREIRDGIETR